MEKSGIFDANRENGAMLVLVDSYTPHIKSLCYCLVRGLQVEVDDVHKALDGCIALGMEGTLSFGMGEQERGGGLGSSPNNPAGCVDTQANIYIYIYIYV